MSLNLTEFNPSSAADLSKAIAVEVSQIGRQWWENNSTLVEGYLNSLAEASVQTSTALAEKRINRSQADQIMKMQELAFKSTLHFTKYMTFVLAQKVFDKAFQLIGWAIFNQTGINLFPSLVQPKAN